MIKKGRCVALATTALGVGVLLAAGFLHRQDIRWWWRMRGVVQVRIQDFRSEGTADISLTSPAAIAHASEVTRKWIGSLIDASRSQDVKPTIPMIASCSHVIFLPTMDPNAWIEKEKYGLIYYESEMGFVDCEDGICVCTAAEWHEFLRDLIRPAIPDLARRMKNPQLESKTRLEAARTIAWVEPKTEGLLESLVEAKDIRGLGLMGPSAEPAVPFLLRLLLEESTEYEDKVNIVESLGRIGTGAVKAVPVLIHLLQNPEEVPDEDVLDEEVPEKPLWAIRSLGSIGPAASEAIPVLETYAGGKKGYEDFKGSAAEALKKIREKPR